MRFKHGIFLTPKLLGYDKDEDGNLVLNEDEAQTVQLIFFMYLYGYSTTEIATTLGELGRRTKRGNTTWSSASIIQILQNERHCGDVLARKTFTPNYLNHKSKKNNKDRNQYMKRDHHDPIVSRDDFIAVQRMLRKLQAIILLLLKRGTNMHSITLRGVIGMASVLGKTEMRR
jgi:hypothetical protein